MTDAEQAISGVEDKLDPGEVPLFEFTGGVKGEQTGGKALLAFTAPDGSNVGIRLSDAEWRKMVEQVEAVGVAEP